MRWARRSASGKEVALILSVERGSISSATLSGDFFCYPEEGAAVLAQALVGIPFTSLRREGEKALRTAAREMHLVLVGITLDDVVHLLEGAS